MLALALAGWGWGGCVLGTAPMASLQMRRHFFQTNEMSEQLKSRHDIRLCFLKRNYSLDKSNQKIFFSARNKKYYSDPWGCQTQEPHEDKQWNNHWAAGGVFFIQVSFIFHYHNSWNGNVFPEKIFLTYSQFTFYMLITSRFAVLQLCNRAGHSQQFEQCISAWVQKNSFKIIFLWDSQDFRLLEVLLHLFALASLLRLSDHCMTTLKQNPLWPDLPYTQM